MLSSADQTGNGAIIHCTIQYIIYVQGVPMWLFAIAPRSCCMNILGETFLIL